MSSNLIGWTIGAGRWAARHPLLMGTLLGGAAVASCATEPCACSPPSATTIELVQGDGQVGNAGQALPDSIVVVVRYLAEPRPPASGLPVWFEPQFGGAASPMQAVTDPTGRAATAWTLRPDAGPDTLVIAAADADADVEVGATAR